MCPLGLFECNFLPFGLRNANSPFQQFIDQICYGLTNVIPSVDELIIFSSSKEEHMMHLQQLFQRLDDYDIVSGVVKVSCALGQGIILRPLSTKATEFEVKIGTKERMQKLNIYCSYFDLL